MPEGISTYAANATLNAMGRNTSFVVAQLYIQLHTGAPGAAGTANVASNNTRKALSFSAAASGAMSNSAEVRWNTVPATETYTKATVWDAASGGNFIGSGALTNGAVTAGDNWVLAVGQFTLNFTVAS